MNLVYPDLVYLATPYSHPDAEVRQARFVKVSVAAAYFVRKGEFIFSPITHFHPMAKYAELPGEWEFWKTIDETYLQHCKALYVLGADGWQESKGVTAEIEIARNLGIPISVVDPNAYTLEPL